MRPITPISDKVEAQRIISSAFSEARQAMGAVAAGLAEWTPAHNREEVVRHLGILLDLTLTADPECAEWARASLRRFADQANENVPR